MNNTVIDEVAGLYQVTLLRILRRTAGVRFDAVPIASLEHLGAIDRVVFSVNP